MWNQGRITIAMITSSEVSIIDHDCAISSPLLTALILPPPSDNSPPTRHLPTTSSLPSASFTLFLFFFFCSSCTKFDTLFRVSVFFLSFPIQSLLVAQSYYSTALFWVAHPLRKSSHILQTSHLLYTQDIDISPCTCHRRGLDLIKIVLSPKTMWTHGNSPQRITISASIQQLLPHLNVCLLPIDLQYLLQVILCQLLYPAELLTILVKFITSVTGWTKLRNLVKVLSLLQWLHPYQRGCPLLLYVYHMVVSLSNTIRSRNPLWHDVHLRLYTLLLSHPHLNQIILTPKQSFCISHDLSNLQKCIVYSKQCQNHNNQINKRLIQQLFNLFNLKHFSLTRKYINTPKMSKKGQPKSINPLAVIFRFLQNKARVEVWLFDNNEIRLQGKILGFDQYMNIVLDETYEIRTKTNTSRPLGKIMIKGENVTLIRSVNQI